MPARLVIERLTIQHMSCEPFGVTLVNSVLRGSTADLVGCRTDTGVPSMSATQFRPRCGLGARSDGTAIRQAPILNAFGASRLPSAT
jgi:hypothetical protein